MTIACTPANAWIFAASFQKNSPTWAFETLRRRVGEWFELKISQLKLPDGPDFAPFQWPDWIGQTLGWLWENWTISFMVLVLLLVGVGLWRFYQGNTWEWKPKASRSPRDEFANSTANYWLKEAQRFQKNGQYNRACRALYMALLHRLDDRDQAPHQVSRTDQEYLQLTQNLPPEQAYQLLLETHERLCFTSDSATADLFQQCKQAFDEIERVQAQLAKSQANRSQTNSSAGAA